MNEIILRRETATDHRAVEALVKAAFKTASHSDGTEHQLVAALRRSDAFIPELSIVAEAEERLVGHVLLTRIHIVTETNRHPALALAPVSVLPEYQRRGIGGDLIRRGHEAARNLGESAVILLGHPDYYPRFGYRRASEFGIQLPFPAPDESCMAMELHPQALQNVHGVVRYPPEFGLDQSATGK